MSTTRRNRVGPTASTPCHAPSRVAPAPRPGSDASMGGCVPAIPIAGASITRGQRGPSSRRRADARGHAPHRRAPTLLLQPCLPVTDRPGRQARRHRAPPARCRYQDTRARHAADAIQPQPRRAGSVVTDPAARLARATTGAALLPASPRSGTTSWFRRRSAPPRHRRPQGPGNRPVRRRRTWRTCPALPFPCCAHHKRGPCCRFRRCSSHSTAGRRRRKCRRSCRRWQGCTTARSDTGSPPQRPGSTAGPCHRRARTCQACPRRNCARRRRVRRRRSRCCRRRSTVGRPRRKRRTCCRFAETVHASAVSHAMVFPVMPPTAQHA